MATLPTPVVPTPDRPTSPMGINALSPSTDAIFPSSTKKGSGFSPIGSPNAMSPIGTPLGGIMSPPTFQSAFPPSPQAYRPPLAPTLRNNRLSSDVGYDLQDRPAWGSMGNLPLFNYERREVDESREAPGLPPQTFLSPHSTVVTSSMSPTSVSSISFSPHRTSLEQIPGPQGRSISPSYVSGAFVTIPNVGPANTVPAAPANSPSSYNRPAEYLEAPFATRVAAPPAGSVSGPSGPSITASVRPVPLHRAGSAGGVLMHIPRRGSAPTTPNPSLLGTSFLDSTAWGTANAPSAPVHDQESEDWLSQFGGMEMESNVNVNGGQNGLGLSFVPSPVGSAYQQPSPMSTHPYQGQVQNSLYQPGASYHFHREYDSIGDSRLEQAPMHPRSISGRYLPNQPANFGASRASPVFGGPAGFGNGGSAGFGSESISAASAGLPLSSLPSYLQQQPQQPATFQSSSPHSPHPALGMSPQLGGLTGSPSSMPSPSNMPSYGVTKYSSRILMVHNYDQLGLDATMLRTLFSNNGGPIRSVSPFPESNALLISFFDLRHAQKAMAALNNKLLTTGATLELQFHFLRESAGLMSKDANQGTLVIFNLDPAISNAELMDLFSKHGEIKEIRESPNRKHKFVEFYDVRCAEKAIKVLNKTDLHGRKIKIEPSRPGGASKMEGPVLNAAPPRRGSVGPLPSTMYGNAPLHAPSMMQNHAFTHSTPTLPTMTGVGNNFGGFSSPTNIFNNTLGAPGAYGSLSASPRFFEALTEENTIFAPLSSEAIPNAGSLQMMSPSSQTLNSPTSTMHAANANAGFLPRRRTISLDNAMVNSTNVLSLDRFIEASISYADVDSSDVSSEVNSTTASLFSGPSDSHHALPQIDLSSAHEGIQGLLMSPPTTPHSASHMSPGSSGDSSSPSDSNSGDLDNALALSPRNMDEDSPNANSAGNGASMASGNAYSSSSSSNAHDNPVPIRERFDIIISQVHGGHDTRTTLMIKNIPNKYDQDMLLLAVNKHHQGTYDFFYLPIDFKNRCNVGYAFINFIDPRNIPAFHEEFDSKKWEKFNSEKVCRISYARIQGKISMIEHFKNSSLMFEDPKCRPLIFHSEGTAVGKPEPFPVGPNVRPRSRKDSTGSSSSAGAAFPTSSSPSPIAPAPAAAPTSPSRAYKPKKDKPSTPIPSTGAPGSNV